MLECIVPVAGRTVTHRSRPTQGGRGKYRSSGSPRLPGIIFRSGAAGLNSQIER